jgi:hypothetical protein
MHAQHCTVPQHMPSPTRWYHTISKRVAVPECHRQDVVFPQRRNPWRNANPTTGYAWPNRPGALPTTDTGPPIVRGPGLRQDAALLISLIQISQATLLLRPKPGIYFLLFLSRLSFFSFFSSYSFRPVSLLWKCERSERLGSVHSLSCPSFLLRFFILSQPIEGNSMLISLFRPQLTHCFELQVI